MVSISLIWRIPVHTLQVEVYCLVQFLQEPEDVLRVVKLPVYIAFSGFCEMCSHCPETDAG